MKLRLVLSGGQTGADRTGLECAKALGIKTGGTAPKGYRTEEGSDLSLKDFGLVESKDWNYQSRTRRNVMDADATVWFGNVGSPGYWCTSTAADNHSKPFFINPSADTMRDIANNFEIINVAGNRESKNRKVVSIVREAFAALQKEEKNGTQA